MKNSWYVYENDIHGVNGLLSFETRAELASYLLTDDFYESRFDETNDALTEIVTKASGRFASSELDGPGLSSVLEAAFGEHDSEVESIEVEDFLGLCSGKSGFAEEAIEIFCEKEEIDFVPTISDDLKPAFLDFMDNCVDYWIG